ncbi:hypothetical protein HA402_004892 [Bradysia odoriphaga]|nr:hypothetical protein HA402_004892 [Bradysia odoriphaga]
MTTIYRNHSLHHYFVLSVDGSYLLTCGSDKKLKLWNPLTGLLLKTYGGHANEVTDAAGSCDSCFIVSASLDKSIIYWDVPTAQPLRRLRCHAGGVNCVRFNEDSGLAISGGKDNMAMCWDIRTRKQEPIQVLNDAKDCITSIVCNDHEIITSSLDGCIRHYDIRASQMTCDSIGPPIVHMVQTKDGQCMIVACADNVLRLIDNDSGQILAEYKGHISEDFQIECGILAGDSKICSGSAEGCAIIWDLVDEKEVARIKMGGGVVHSLTTHPTGNDIVFARKREFQVWGLD